MRLTSAPVWNSERTTSSDSWQKTVAWKTRLCGVEAASRNVQSSLIPSLAGFVAVMAIRLCRGPGDGVVSHRRYRCGIQKIDSKSTGFGRRQHIL